MAKKPETQEQSDTCIDKGVVIDQDTPNKAESTAVANWEDQMAQYANEAADSESIIGTFLSMRAGRLSINQAPVQGNALDCIIIASTYENAYYKGKFDPNNPQPPLCYAFGQDEDSMTPHPDVKQKQSETCATCQYNKWKSDPEGGKGKACKNTRRLALLPADAADSPQKAAESDTLYVKLPVTSTRDWGKYVHAVATEMKRPPFGVITTLTTEPDPKNQFKVVFKCKGKITNPEVIPKLMELHESNKKTIGFPYQDMEDATEAASGNKADKF